MLNFPPAPPGHCIPALLERWPSLADIAEIVAGSGIRVSVLQAASHAENLTRNGVDYRFVDVCGAGAARSRGRPFARALAGMGVDLLHVHGLGFVMTACAATARRSPALPVVFQDHADRLPGWWRRPRHRRGFMTASGIAFTSLEQARPFSAAGLFPASARLFAIPESSSRFTPGDQADARAETGIDGDPCVLWVGHLAHGKDPLAVLDGIALAAPRQPNLQLWCAFATAPMLSAVRARIEGDPRLRGRVHLLGKVPHPRIESLLRAADLYVSGSHAEGSGYAAIEAIACGVTPVLTDIPAFRALTGNGRIGHLWPCSDAARLADALLAAAAERDAPQRVRAHFDATLSFEAVGGLWADAYRLVRDDWRRRAA
jgi:glycosyltransferase involved in cell wall biosynthesis